MKLIYYLLLFTCCIFDFARCDISNEGEKERVNLGAASSKFDEPHTEELDHQAILGSQKLANEFGGLSPDESKRRLRVLAKKMDKDSNGFVTILELTEWVYKSLMSLDDEETRERFDEIDADNDGVISWTEYLSEAFGINPGQEANEILTDPEDMKLMREDRSYFDAADTNHDGKLLKDEFSAFQNPEHYEQMHETLIKNTLLEKDANKDGKIDLKEYLGETYDQPNSEWFATEKVRFQEEYDKNNNGFLEGEELKVWLIPDLKETSKQEADHLLESADTDKDGQLTIDEIVEAYKVFVGSEATGYGENLIDVHHEEL